MKVIILLSCRKTRRNIDKTSFKKRFNTVKIKLHQSSHLFFLAEMKIIWKINYFTH